MKVSIMEKSSIISSPKASIMCKVLNFIVSCNVLVEARFWQALVCVCCLTISKETGSGIQSEQQITYFIEPES